MRTQPELLFRTVAGDAELIFRFFAVFSRYEYALKRTGFLVKNRKDATADWDSYANEVRGRLAASTSKALRDACVLLQDWSPRKQVVVSGTLGWESVAQGKGESEEAYVLRLVRVVRNNLFHGGKFPSGPVPEVARNGQLITSCLVVLEESVAWSQDVESAFASET